MIEKEEHFRLQDEAVLSGFLDGELPVEELDEDGTLQYALDLTDSLESETEDDEWDEDDGPSVYGWNDDDEW